jgi:hypothetical protein
VRKEVVWKADEFGRALVAGVHDGRIASFAFAERAYVHLGISPASGGLIAVELSGVGELNIRELCNGSVVSAVYVWNVRSVPRTSWAVSDGGWNLLFANRLAKADVKEAAARIGLNRPKSWLVQVECSYGGAIAAVCDHVAFFNELADEMTK